MFKILWVKGDYYARQQEANREGAKLYIEHHFNASSSKSAGYAVCIVANNASETSKLFARQYSQRVSRMFDVLVGGDKGVVVGGYNGRGAYNLHYTKMPAVLLEPLFVSNPDHVDKLKSPGGIESLAACLADTIKTFVDSGTIAFSVGHKYKDSSPNDRGAAVYGGGTEADYAEKVLIKCEQLLCQNH